VENDDDDGGGGVGDGGSDDSDEGGDGVDGEGGGDGIGVVVVVVVMIMVECLIIKEWYGCRLSNELLSSPTPPNTNTNTKQAITDAVKDLMSKPPPKASTRSRDYR
jgi:hypothetical protein